MCSNALIVRKNETANNLFDQYLEANDKLTQQNMTFLEPDINRAIDKTSIQFNTKVLQINIYKQYNKN